MTRDGFPSDGFRHYLVNIGNMCGMTMTHHLFVKEHCSPFFWLDVSLRKKMFSFLYLLMYEMLIICRTDLIVLISIRIQIIDTVRTEINSIIVLLPLPPSEHPSRNLFCNCNTSTPRSAFPGKMAARLPARANHTFPAKISLWGTRTADFFTARCRACGKRFRVYPYTPERGGGGVGKVILTFFF